MGNSFRNPHKTQPPFTWDKFFPARQPWTKICRGNVGAAWGGGAFSECVSLGRLCTDRTGRLGPAAAAGGALGREAGCRPLTPLIRCPRARRASGDTCDRAARPAGRTAARADGGSLPLASLLELHAQRSGAALTSCPRQGQDSRPEDTECLCPGHQSQHRCVPRKQMGVQS